jgi:hypothetical protein
MSAPAVPFEAPAIERTILSGTGTSEGREASSSGPMTAEKFCLRTCNWLRYRRMSEVRDGCTFRIVNILARASVEDLWPCDCPAINVNNAYQVS